VAVDVLIASPLEAELVERIRASEPRALVLFDPSLLPPPRYPCDHRGVAGFRRDAAGERRFREWLDQAEVLFGYPGDSPDGLADVVRSCPRLGWVQGTAAGTGEVARRAGLTSRDLDRVLLTSAVGVHATPLAEWAMFGLLAFTKGLPRLLADKAGHCWEHHPVRELSRGRLLVVGLGEIGREVARLGRSFGMTVLGVRRQAGDDPSVDEMHLVAELGEVLPAVDAVVLSLPDTDATRGLFSRDLIDRLPRHAVVINVGRGSTVDEAALVDALREHRIAGAALDVSATEPLPEDSPLWSLDNVLLSPHTAALSVRENERIVELFLDNLRRYLGGRPLRNRIDPDHLY
jgi:glyoxylate/hydroxypyruvate reductase